MKRMIVWVLGAMFALSTMTVTAKTPDSGTPAKSEKEIQLSAIEREVLINRVYEIRDMDKSNLTPAQRKELKNELTQIKEQLQPGDQVVIVLSGTAIVIILLLLILL